MYTRPNLPYRTCNGFYQIVLCTSTRPDFNAEEVASVTKDQKELIIIVEDMADHLPIEDPNKGWRGRQRDSSK